MYLFTSAAAVELERHLSILHMKGRKDLSSVNSVGNGRRWEIDSTVLQRRRHQG